MKTIYESHEINIIRFVGYIKSNKIVKDILFINNIPYYNKLPTEHQIYNNDDRIKEISERL
jgi:hypothetical protein